ncbi:MAG: hypothetical protein GYA59_10680, partial [Chloroflexi bacterium]|nr:hypothetical protein [Chloroflexota bacterium]
LCCYRRGRRVSKMILGNTHPSLQVGAYDTAEEACVLIDRFLDGRPGRL